MTITLRPITVENWFDATRLQVSDEQKNYVAPNVFSIALAHFEPTCEMLSVYADDEMVGFILYDTQRYYIVRFMIDARFQGKGYGRAALNQLIAQFERDYAHPVASLSCVIGNVVAERLYESAGFSKTGEIHDNEAVMSRPLQKA